MERVTSERESAIAEGKKILGFSSNIFFLGLTSLFTDIASEMVYPLVPIFLTSVLGAPVAAVGLVEGIAESAASLIKAFSGWFSDRIRKRKALTVLGYGLGAISKPILALSFIWPQVLIARFVDRVGKGVRTSPRDALIAESTSKGEYGKSFGFHRGMDTVGAAIGPLIAFAALPLLKNDFRLFFGLAVVPAVAGVAVLTAFVREKISAADGEDPKLSLRSFDLSFKLFLLVVLVFTIGNSSDAFLILRARNAGIAVGLIPIVYFVFNAVYAFSATPVGSLSDRIGRKAVIVLGCLIFSLVYLGFGLAKSQLTIWLLFAAYGFYYAFAEGIFKAYTADIVPRHLRGTAYGLLNLSLGIALLPASLIAGLLWQRIGPSAPFFFGSAMSLLALVLFAALMPHDGNRALSHSSVK